MDSHIEKIHLCHFSQFLKYIWIKKFINKNLNIFLYKNIHSRTMDLISFLDEIIFFQEFSLQYTSYITP